MRQLANAILGGCTVLCSLPSSAYTVLGGEIRYTHVQGLTYEIQAHIYTDVTNPVDLPSITLHTGTGAVEVPRDQTIDDFTTSCGGVRLSTYTTTTIYPGPGEYMISFTLPFRDVGVANITDPVTQGMCVMTRLVVSPIAGNNNSVRFDTALVATYRVWNTLVHQPGAFDADGDSLIFELVAPLDNDCQAIAGYQLPPAPNMLWLDPSTGVLHWDYPPQAGLWSVAIRCNEWRSGTLIGQVTRDMSICIGSIELGLESAPGHAQFALAPTLVDDLLTLTAPHAGTHQLEIIDAAGAIALRASVAAERTTIDVSALADGLYAVRLSRTIGSTCIGRFVKR